MKRTKYESLQQDCKEKDWLFPVDVGCNGFSAQLVWKKIIDIGMREKERRMTVFMMTETAESASWWL